MVNIMGYFDNSSQCLAHHGVLGQKWGIRRFQDKSGKLTAAGKDHYNTDKAINNVGRAITNTALGQRLSVRLNKGYRKDKKEIKEAYNTEKAKIDKNDKEKLKSLKNDYKLTKGEARLATAQANYSWQSDKANEKMQNESFGKSLLKSFLIGGTGAMTYNNLTAADVDRGTSAVAGLLATYGDAAVGGLGSTGYYAYKKYKSNRG